MYLDFLIGTQWDLFREMDVDWMGFGVLHLKLVSVSNRGGLATQARASVVDHTHWLTGDAKRLVYSQSCGKVFIWRYI